MNAPYELAALPQSKDAEQAVLGGLLLDNEAIDRIGDLRREQFYVHGNGVIFDHIQRLIAQQRPADVVTLFDSIRSAGQDADLRYLNDLMSNTPSAANIGRYADIVREKALLRGMLKAANTVHEIVQGPLPAAEKLDAAQAEFGKLAETTTRREPASIRDALRRYVDALDVRLHGEGPNPGIPTGLKDLDDILNGGIRRGALVTLGARPGMGKSALGETVALNATLAEHSVLFLSMEMPEAEVTERAVASVGKIAATALAKADRDLGQSDGWSRLTHAVQRLEETAFFIDDEPGLSLLQVVTKARAVKRKHGLDLLVVDYLQLMTGTEEKRYQQIEAITKGLKILAKTLNIGVLALSQLNRDVEKRTTKRPQLSDFRDGGSIEQDSDILLGLYREEQDNPDTPNKGFAELFVMKNRQGKTGKVPLTYLGDQMRFENCTWVPPEEPAKPQRRGFRD
ncbi:replicative DNA helicase [Castellaniella ginsengisoli]|uniref:Replicative DNA helicase n=1 Tax=Castellaniella ginsengisoli TaxID=546114 RepID=A0AB39EMZ6_9BURK